MDRRLPSLDDLDLERIRGKLYRSIGDLELWPEALRELARAVGATGVVITLPSFDARLGYSFDSVVVNVDFGTAVSHAVASGTLDPWTEGSIRQGYRGAGHVLRGAQMCDPREVERTSWKSAVFDPAEMGDLLTASLPAPDGAQNEISLAVFHRHRPCEPFEPDAADRLRLFLDDLSTSARVAFALSAARHRTILVESAMDAVGRPVIVLDRTCRVRYFNRAAAALLRRDAALFVREGHLAAKRHRDNERLARAMFHASHRRTATSIPLARPGRTPLVLTTTPFAPDDFEFDSVSPVGVLVTVDGLDGEIAAADAIRAALDLTLAEAKVARALATGASLPQAAAALGVSTETVRSHLKSVFGKLHVAKQADVVHLVRRVPTVPR